MILRDMKKKHKLSWLRPKMSHHKFTNLGEMFNADLTTKVMEEIADEELKDRPCNCIVKTLNSEGKCQYNGHCRTSMVVYEDYPKKRTSDHYHDVWNLREAQLNGKTYAKTDAFAKHFVQFC